MKTSLLALCALLLTAPLSFARGGGGGRGFSAARSSSGFRAGSQGFSGVSRGFSSGFSPSVSRPSFGRSASFRPAARPAVFHFAGRATFHASAPRSTRRLSGSGSAPAAWATIGAKIVSEGQPPVYSEAAGGGTHSVEGGGFIAMDQSKARDVGRAPGVTWGAPDRTAAVSTGGGGSGGSSNGPAPAFDPSF